MQISFSLHLLSSDFDVVICGVGFIVVLVFCIFSDVVGGDIALQYIVIIIISGHGAFHYGRASLDCVRIAWGSFVGDDGFTAFVHFHAIFDAALSIPAAACLSQTVSVSAVILTLWYLKLTSVLAGHHLIVFAANIVTLDVLFTRWAMMNSNKHAHTFNTLYVGMATWNACSHSTLVSMSEVNNTDFTIQIMSVCMLTADLDMGMITRM
ncbi:hypothetical protein Tco_1329122 [Tanacetum coccineum]